MTFTPERARAITRKAKDTVAERKCFAQGKGVEGHGVGECERHGRTEVAVLRRIPPVRKDLFGEKAVIAYTVGRDPCTNGKIVGHVLVQSLCKGSKRGNIRLMQKAAPVGRNVQKQPGSAPCRMKPEVGQIFG